MLRLTRLNGQVIYINYLQVLYMESIPETKIKLMDGNFYLVKDSVESIQAQIRDLMHDIIVFGSKQELNTALECSEDYKG